MDRPEEWKTVSKEKVADCRVFDVTERHSIAESGREASFYVIESPDWVNVIPVTLDGEILLIEQYRHGTEDVTLEIPGGLVDEGESPDQCASRELTEETGFVAGKIIPLGRSRPNPAIQSNWIYHFLAEDCVGNGEKAFDEHESISVRKVKVGEIDGLIENGSISHSLVLAGFLKFMHHRNKAEIYTYES